MVRLQVFMKPKLCFIQRSLLLSQRLVNVIFNPNFAQENGAQCFIVSTVQCSTPPTEKRLLLAFCCTFPLAARSLDFKLADRQFIKSVFHSTIPLQAKSLDYKLADRQFMKPVFRSTIPWKARSLETTSWQIGSSWNRYLQKVRRVQDSSLDNKRLVELWGWWVVTENASSFQKILQVDGKLQVSNVSGKILPWGATQTWNQYNQDKT